jgi:hypothetical protein
VGRHPETRAGLYPDARSSGAEVPSSPRRELWRVDEFNRRGVAAAVDGVSPGIVAHAVCAAGHRGKL